MQDYITYYIESNSLTSINAFTERSTFSSFVENYYDDADQVNEILAMIDYEEWIYEVGLDPTGTLNFTNSATTAALNLANAYIALNGTGSPSNYADYNSFVSNQRVVFVQTILHNSDTNTAILTQIDNDLNITGSTDPEVRQRWYSIGLYLYFAPVYTPAETWVGQIGRNKYLNSIYEALSESGQNALGITWYRANQYFYSPVTQQLIEGILGL